MGQTPGGVLAVAWDRYQRQLRREPLQTKAATAGVLAVLSDVLAQKLAGSRTVNWRRASAVGAFGLVVSGPANHYWQQLVQRTFGPKSDPNTVTFKVLLDNLTFSPAMSALFLFYLALAVEGLSQQAATARLKTVFPDVLLNGWKFWPLVSALNYSFVPLDKRVLVINLAALCWNTFINVRSRPAAPALKRS